MLRKTFQLSFLIIVSSVFILCKTKKVKDEITFTSKEKTAEIHSEDKSKILILNYVLDKNPVITFNYQVIEAKTKEELLKGVFVGEKIEWLDNTSLKCKHHVGMIQKDNDQILEENKNDGAQYTIIKIN